MLIFLLAGVGFAFLGAEEGKKEEKKIVMIAGPKSHGSGQHDHINGVKLFENALKSSGIKGFQVETYLGAWPEDDSVLDDAASIMIYSDGRQKHILDDKAIKKLRNLSKKGVGLMFIHWALDPPRKEQVGDFVELLGGAFDPDYSRNPINRPKAKFVSPDHPVSRGCLDFAVEDEFYFKLRFREKDTRFTPIIKAPLPWQKPNDEVLSWVIEKENGGRVFGFTGGHFHKNWNNESMRRVVLNAVLWTAGIDVPKDGVHWQDDKS